MCDHILWIRLEGRAISINKYIVTIYIPPLNLNSRCMRDFNKSFETSIIPNNTECSINFNFVSGELHGQSSEKYVFFY